MSEIITNRLSRTVMAPALVNYALRLPVVNNSVSQWFIDGNIYALEEGLSAAFETAEAFMLFGDSVPDWYNNKKKKLTFWQKLKVCYLVLMG